MNTIKPLSKCVKGNEDAYVTVDLLSPEYARVCAADWDGYDGYTALYMTPDQMREFATILNEAADGLEAYNASRSKNLPDHL